MIRGFLFAALLAIASSAVAAPLVIPCNEGNTCTEGAYLNGWRYSTDEFGWMESVYAAVAYEAYIEPEFVFSVTVTDTVLECVLGCDSTHVDTPPTWEQDVQPVPEPKTVYLMGAALMLVAAHMLSRSKA